MSLRRPAKNQPENFEFSSSSLEEAKNIVTKYPCLLYTSPSPRDVEESRMPSSA